MPRTVAEVSKETIINAIRELGDRLARYPTYSEFHHETGLSQRQIIKHFGCYSKALRACGFKPCGQGNEVDIEELFLDWAAAVRRLGRVPTAVEYEGESKFSRGPFQKRFGKWGNAAERMVDFAEGKALRKEWEDVIAITRAYLQRKKKAEEICSPLLAWTSLPGLMQGRPLYGEPVMASAMATAPVNELGVVFLFGMLAKQLGFLVLRIQAEFPDCEALRQMEEKRWQGTRIEFELLSRNFLDHGHDPAKCDLIVCWEHNWPDCPLEVLELKKVVESLQGIGR